MRNIISIVPRAEEQNAQLASAFVDFESRLCDLRCMAQLALDAVVDLDDARQPPSDDQVNLAIFAVRHLLEMTEAAKAEWYRGWRAGGNDASA